jgi:hypothetical protein
MMATDRRPLGVSVHEWQHSLIFKRFEVWRRLPKSNKDLNRIRRREAGKVAWNTLVGHVRQFHDRDLQITPKTTYQNVATYHEGFHDEDDE